MNTRHVVIETPPGPVTIVAKDETITGLYFGHPARRPPEDTFGPQADESTDPLLNEAVRQLRDYLAGRRRQFDLPLRAEGDSFQHAVRDIVKHTQCADTATHGRTAGQAGDHTPARKAGRAAATNPPPAPAPHHHAAGSTGALPGHAGGPTPEQPLPAPQEPPTDSKGRSF
ncbi:MGMT family protein [Streptomyces sp. NPDC093252]|uniref:methylated-DNA--[protein]-cysteine S-methyltransferase n=1 Tax=Streptomyces sp. NPDC093252 TaxID=3154980 RepID=UPI00344A9D56